MACEIISCSVCSLTRDRTRVPEWGVWNLSHWATREVPLGWLVLKHTWLIKLLWLFFSSTKNCICSYDLILGSLGGPGMVFLILIQMLMQKHVSSLLRQQGNRHHDKCWLTPSLGSGQWRARPPCCSKQLRQGMLHKPMGLTLAGASGFSRQTKHLDS